MPSLSPPVLPPFRASRARALRSIAALMLREIGAANGRSALGYLWEVVEPVAYILLLTFLFGLFLQAPPLGTSFPLFYASGILPFLMFLEVTNRVSGAIRFSRPLLTYPGVTFLDAILARFLVAAVTKVIVFSVVLALLVAFWRVEPFFDAARLVEGVVAVLLMALSVGTMNCLLMAFFPLYDRIWMLVTKPLLVISAVIYMFDTVPLPWRDWLWWNPVVHLVGMVRGGIYPTYHGDYVSLPYLAALVSLTLPPALFFLRRYWREVLEVA
jgi:capsular polysaccharide transport system permease protein